MTLPRALAAVTALALVWPAASSAQQPPHAADPVGEALFPPELVMRHQKRIGLGEEQRRTLTKEMQALQTEAVALQIELQAASEQLIDVLRTPRVDEARALAQADAVMQLEQRIKRRHLRFLVRLKNLLTPAQQAKLRELRKEP